MTSRFRRDRGAPTVALHIFVAPDVKDKLDAYARAKGAPQWAVLEAAIRAGAPGDDGWPQGWELPEPGQPQLDLEEDEPTHPQT
ncbi:Protein of unknown function [Propionibacterium freudenreichii]|uniref:hypothetical protein n=1 Tax=Propionibacterium TaxID=1743 RepID=UPI0005435261|nr:hypothetical protein [Propionibacterium freudenreichii]CEG87476.1 Protein of unknown function [Propionibacterium freudenreichii]CEI30283.1 Protein of unknown function [Propionibacterium freudenreichii]